jgi:hypothetical protein
MATKYPAISIKLAGLKVAPTTHLRELVREC